MEYKVKIKPRYSIGTRIQDQYRDIELIDFVRESGRYAYRYKCYICGYDGQEVYYHNDLIRLGITETQLKGKKSCSVCSGRVVAPYINSIAIERPDLVKYFINQDEAYKYRPHSNAYTNFKCPICCKVYKKCIDEVSTQGLRCENCTDKKSMGERILREILNTLNEDYIMEYTNTSASWCRNYRYDFYLCKYNIIVEIHGRQHYVNTPPFKNLKEQQQIDKIKEDLAKENNINQYIVIDAKKSDFDYIYNSFMNSPLLELLNLQNIDKNTIKGKVFSTSTLINVCTYWKENSEPSISHMVQTFKLSDVTIRDYLKRGTELNLCSYNPLEKIHIHNIGENYAHEYSKPIYCPEINTYFKSIGLASKHSNELFGRHIGDSTIREIVKDKRKSTRKINYTFIYVSKKEFNDAVTNDTTKTYGSAFLKVS